MRRSTLLAALLLSSSWANADSALSEQTLNATQELKNHAMVSQHPWNILESLTTEVGPRLPGTEGDVRAVQWAMDKFKQLGFSKVYKEPVKVPYWYRGSAHASVVAPFPQPLTITALGNSVAADVTAQIIRFDNLEALIQADAAQVKGKIVFIDHKMERYRDGRGYGPVVKARGKGAVEAAKKGAVAMLLRSVGTDSHRFAHTGVMRYVDYVDAIPAAALSNPDADQITRMLSRGEKVEVNVKLTSENRGEATSYNVIAEIPGSDLANEVVIIGAHLDSWDEGTGALDDGAGVAIVTGAAKHILERGLKPRRTIRVVLFAAEEIGLVGAKAYRDAHKDTLDSIYIAAEADFGAGPIYQFNTRVNESALDSMEIIAKQLESLGVKLGNNASWGGPDVSILPALGVPVAGLSMDGTDYFDYHHTADDTLDKVDPDALRQSSAVYTLYAWMMANLDEELRPIPLPKQ